MTREEITKLLQSFWDNLSEYLLGINVTGSLVIPYIINKHDIDIIYVGKTYDSLKEARRILRENEELKTLKRNLHDNYNINLIGHLNNYNEMMYIYSYEQPIVLFGEESQVKKDIINMKDDYVNACKLDFQRLKRIYEEQGIIYRSLYHILTGIYYIQNNSYDLTEEQIKNINIVHDGEEKDKEIIFELYQFVYEWLSNN